MLGREREPPLLHSVSFGSVRCDSDGLEWSLDNAPTDGTTVTLATVVPPVPFDVEMKITTPDVTPTTDYNNHGDFVSQQPDKNDAAHSCIGMPITPASP